MEQKGIPCIGGPLDGQWWPAGKGPPVVPIFPPMRVTVEPDPTPTKIEYNLIRYREHNMRQPMGAEHIYCRVFAPDDWTVEQLAKRLDEVAPQGIS